MADSLPFAPLKIAGEEDLPALPQGTVGYQGQTLPSGATLLPLQTSSGAVIPQRYDPSSESDIMAQQSGFSIQEKLQSLAEGSGVSGQHKFLAFVAALTGNLGPAIALQELQRKAGVASKLFPITTNINKLKASGYWPEAMDALSSAVSAVGPQTPELIAPLQAQQADLSARMDKWEQLKTWAKYMDDDAVVAADHPDRPAFRKLHELTKGKPSNISMDLVNRTFQMLTPHIQELAGKISITGPMSAQSKFYNVPQPFDDATLRGLPGQLFAQMVPGATPETAANFLNRNEKITLASGEVIQPTEENKNNLRHIITLAQGKAGGAELAKNVPLAPEVAITMQAMGVPRDVLATREYTPEQAEMGKEAWFKHALDVAKGTITAKMDDRTAPGSIGVTGMTLTPGDFGRRIDGLSFNEMDKQGLHPIKSEVFEQVVAPAVTAMQGLGRVTDMWNALGNPQGPWENVPQRINDVLSRWTGLPIGEDTNLAEAAALIVKRSIEEVEKTTGSKEVTAGLLKSLTTGSFANADRARETVGYLQGRLEERLGRYVEPKLFKREDIQKTLNIVSGSRGSADLIKLAQAYNVDPRFASSVKTQEWSGVGPAPMSTAGAVGEYQIMPDTAKQYDFTEKQLHNPELNPTVAMHIMRDLNRTYPNRPDLQAAAYASGKGNIANGKIVDENKIVGGKTTVRMYVDAVLKRMGLTQEQLTGQAAAAPVLKPGVLQWDKRR